MKVAERVCVFVCGCVCTLHCVDNGLHSKWASVFHNPLLNNGGDVGDLVKEIKLALVEVFGWSWETSNDLLHHLLQQLPDVRCTWGRGGGKWEDDESSTERKSEGREEREGEKKSRKKKKTKKKIQSVNLRAHAHPSKPRARLTATAANGCVADATC